MELVKRYIAAVQRELPEAKRDEIGRELNANIMDQLDMLSEQQGELTDTDIAAVLKQMGHPRTVAQQFVPPQPLISLHYMPVYRYTLYMVLGVLFVLQVMGNTINWVNHDIGLLLYLKGVADGFIKDGCFAFTAITITFALISADPAKAVTSQSDNWQPQQLPVAGHSWQHISLQDIFTDLATYAFLLVVIWYPAAPSTEPRIWLTVQADMLLQWCSPLLVGGIIFSLWQLKQRWWNNAMLKLNVALNLAFVIILVYLATGGPAMQLDLQYWQEVFTQQQLQQAVTVVMLIVALFPLHEVIRDIRRLYFSAK